MQLRKLWLNINGADRMSSATPKRTPLPISCAASV